MAETSDELRNMALRLAALEPIAPAVEASAEDFTRDPAEEACYDIQLACWSFQKAIEQAETSGRLEFLDGMLTETKKRIELVIIAVGARQAQIDEAKR